MRTIGRIGMCALLVAGALVGTAGHARALVVQQTLAPTATTPGARGRASFVLKRGTKGRLRLTAKRLPASARFDVVANGVKIGSLETTPAGSGKLGLATTPHAGSGLLGFEPRGASLAVRDAHGDAVLEGTLPDGSVDPNEVACCTTDDGHPECEPRTPDRCVARGGTVASTPTCVPDPCGGTSGGGDVVCCFTDSAAGAFEDDDPDVACKDDLSASECTDHGGTVVQATSCDPNPCAPVPPPTLVVCCVSDDEDGNAQGAECERLTPAHCTAHGGTVSTAASCDPNPCSGGGGGQGGDGGDGDSGHTGSHD